MVCPAGPRWTPSCGVLPASLHHDAHRTAPQRRATFHQALLAEELAGDDLPLNLGRALVDPQGADVAVERFQDVAALEGGGAVELDRCRSPAAPSRLRTASPSRTAWGPLPRRSRRPWPRLARAAASPRFASPSRRAGARPPGTHATPYRRHAAPPYGRSPPPALPAPCRSRRRRRSAERRSASASRPGSRRRPHRAPPRRAPRHRRAESADRVWRNEVEMPSAEADRVARDDEGCQPSRAGTRRRTREHRVDVRLRSIRDPLLDARQAPAAPVALCDEADRRDIRAGLGSVSAKAETASPGTKAGTHRWITPRA